MHANSHVFSLFSKKYLSCACNVLFCKSTTAYKNASYWSWNRNRMFNIVTSQDMFISESCTLGPCDFDISPLHSDQRLRQCSKQVVVQASRRGHPCIYVFYKTLNWLTPKKNGEQPEIICLISNTGRKYYSTGRITQGSARSKPAQFLPGQLADFFY